MILAAFYGEDVNHLPLGVSNMSVSYDAMCVKPVLESVGGAADGSIQDNGGALFDIRHGPSCSKLIDFNILLLCSCPSCHFDKLC